MPRILITGATGNVGTEVIRYLGRLSTKVETVAAVRDPATAGGRLPKLPNGSYRRFDFTDATSFAPALAGVDALFLLRPPALSQVDKYFRPLLEAAWEGGLRRVVFLSVQGVEKSSFIPHHRIEALIRELGFDFIFVRPSYFMQNLTTTLLPEIRDHRRITLPAGTAPFNWVDVANVGEAAARLLLDFDDHRNRAYEITGPENLNFAAVTALLSRITEVPFAYRSVNPVVFFFRKRREGIPSGFAAVMTLLHFLPRWQAAPSASDDFARLTGRDPTTLAEFIEREVVL